MIRVNASPLPLLRRRLRRREPPSLDWPRFWSTFSSSRPSLLSMPHHSPSKSPQAPRASLSKAGKDDAHDANIRNFAPVARIMKNALPENAKIAKEAKECMQECVSEFISFITSEGKPSLFFFFFQTSSSSPAFCLRAGDRRVSRKTSRYFQILTGNSLREMPSRKTKNRQWRGHLVCHDIIGV